MDIFKESKELCGELVSVRRELHENAETGFFLQRTFAIIERELSSLGLEAKRCQGGIFADIEGKGNEKILLRADCDALPIAEKSGLPFAAENGNGHLCGHDMHAAMLLGAAKLIARHRDSLACGVRLLFQAAEEILGGARACIEDGAAKDCVAAYALHVVPSLPLECGTVILPPPNAVAPHARFFSVTIEGKGAHGAAAHNGHDALLCAAHVVCALQTPIAREADPASVAALTVGTFNAEGAANAICGSAELCGTLRAFDKDEAERLVARTEEISDCVARAFGCKAKTVITSSCPALINSPKLLEYAKSTLKATFPEDAVIDAAALGTKKSVGGSEDFAYFSQEMPSLFFSVCAGRREFCRETLHHPEVRFDEGCLPFGSAALAALALGENNY